MRDIPQALLTKLGDSDQVIEFFILVTLQFPTLTYNFTSLPYDFTYKGSSYKSDGGLAYYENPAYTSVINKASYKLSFSDQTGELLAHLRANVTTSKLRVLVGLYSTDQRPTESNVTTLLMYQGSIDSPEFGNDLEDKVITLVAGSPMSALDQTNLLETSSSSLKSRNPNDTAFDNVFEKGESVVRWGK